MRKPRGEWLANGMLMDYFSATSCIVLSDTNRQKYTAEMI
jgi:hypothetical protein